MDMNADVLPIVGLLAVALIIGIVDFLKKTLRIHIFIGGRNRKK